MALAGRNPRRRGAKWWLAAGIVLTLLVLLVDASLGSRSPGPVTTLAGQTWVDRVLPIIGQSTTQGTVINQIRAGGLTMQATTINAELEQTAVGAQSSLEAVQALRPPPSVAVANGALVICLQTRAQAAASLAAAMAHALSGPVAAQATASAPAIQVVGQQLLLADQAYRLFVQDLPHLGVTLPPSAWYTGPADYAEPGLSTYLQSLRAVTSAVPLHDVAIDAVTTNPPAVTVRGAVQILPPAPAISVQATVANVGNQPEANLPISATLTPAAHGYPATVKAVVSLSAGHALSLTVGNLTPPVNIPVTLTVTLGPAPGETLTADNTKVVVLQMP